MGHLAGTSENRAGQSKPAASIRRIVGSDVPSHGCEGWKVEGHHGRGLNAGELGRTFHNNDFFNKRS